MRATNSMVNMDGYSQRSGGLQSADRYNPLWVGQVDIAGPPTPLDDIGQTPSGLVYNKARILIRFQAEALGMMTTEIIDGSIDVVGLHREAAALFSDEIRVIAGSDAVPAGSDSVSVQGSAPLAPLSAELSALAEQPLPAVSVVIGTRNRPAQVVECTQLVLKQDYPAAVEVIIVDNGASSPATADAVAAAFGTDDRVRYLVEERPGLSRARNIGLNEARYPVTAFLSDDIHVDSMWLLAVARGFARHDDVHCVTGFCPPLYLDTEEQLLFESSMAWGSRQGFTPVLFGFESEVDPLHPYRPGQFANGSNMAFDTEVFRSMGGFDEVLGPGTKARGGEDLDAPIRILADGGRVAYEPAVIGWHADAYDDRAFSKHMYTYGLGLTAFLAKHLIEKRSRRAVVSRISPGLPALAKAFVARDETLSADVSMPVKYHLWQLAGRLAGPFAYLASRRALRN